MAQPDLVERADVSEKQANAALSEEKGLQGGTQLTLPLLPQADAIAVTPIASNS